MKNSYQIDENIIHKWEKFSQNYNNISDSELVQNYKESDLYGILWNKKEEILKILQDGSWFCIIDNIKISELQQDIAKKILILLSVELGEPTKTDMIREKIAWEITPRKELTVKNSTFSERDWEAKLHTDTQYYPNPENFFLLGCYNRAEKWWESILLSLRDIVSELKNKNPELLKKLKNNKFPFMVPSSFTRSGSDDNIEIFMSPIISWNEQEIRYRYDTLEKWLKFVWNSELKDIIEEFENFLQESQDVKEFQLENNEILICNNYNILHGRKTFSDQNRLLFRIRFN